MAPEAALSPLAALLLSLAVEAAVAALALARRGSGAALRGAGAAMLATLATQPTAWQAMWDWIPDLGYLPAVALAEALVVLFEAPFYALLVPLPWGRALALALLANAASLGVGLLAGR